MCSEQPGVQRNPLSYYLKLHSLLQWIHHTWGLCRISVWGASSLPSLLSARGGPRNRTLGVGGGGGAPADLPRPAPNQDNRSRTHSPDSSMEVWNSSFKMFKTSSTPRWPFSQGSGAGRQKKEHERTVRGALGVDSRGAPRCGGEGGVIRDGGATPGIKVR